MEKLNFYSYGNSEQFLKKKFQTVCLLGACTAKNLALGIEYFSNNSLKAYAPYETLFNLPSMLNDLEIVSKKLDHKIIINSELEEFSDKIRFWNHSKDIEKVILENKRIDSCISEGIKNSDLVIVSLGSVEMWKYSNQVMNRLPKNQFYNSEIENIYLNATDAQKI
ncbi:GSCFA domain-containing protein, partial [Streptococcus pluranimalium]|uniref:GSCFA domain-containing protein n=1 Tax=Streptococcus pluranimalium TaxID=82348 RepID=UPI003BF8AD65